MNNRCLICNRIEAIKKKENPYFVKELETGYVVLGDHQFYKGYTLFLSKIHVPELHELEKSFKIKFLEEMAIVAEAVYKAFGPVKLNYELLGNGDPHLHWHLFPRYKDDPNPGSPIWTIDKSVRNAGRYKLTKEELQQFKNKILRYMKLT